LILNNLNGFYDLARRKCREGLDLIPFLAENQAISQTEWINQF